MLNGHGLSLFELGKCSLHKNGVEFHQKENGGKSSNIIGNCENILVLDKPARQVGSNQCHCFL